MAKPDAVLFETDRYPWRCEIATRFQDMDPNHHLNNVAMAVLFEDMRVRFDVQAGLEGFYRGEELGALVASLQIEYLGEAFYPQPVTMYAGIETIGRSSWTLTGLACQGAAKVAFHRAVVVCVQGERPAPLPGNLRAMLEAQAIRLTP